MQIKSLQINNFGKLKNREIVIEKEHKDVEFVEQLQGNFSYVISPIITNGDVIGTVIIFSENDNIGDLEVKFASVTSNFLGRHIEE